ncbi:LysR family transcriptional regulator substrate-binding protein [Streptomyces luteolus]
MGERNTPTRDYIEAMLRENGVDPRVAVEVPQRGAVVPTVLSGAGAAIVSLRVAMEAHQRGAVVREVDPPLQRRIGLVHRSGRLTKAAAAFLSETKADLASWNRAFDRRMSSGMSRIEAAGEVMAAMEKRQLDRFRERSPIAVEGTGAPRTHRHLDS